MICTKPASSEPPASQLDVFGQSMKVTSPSKHFDASAHQALCSDRVLLRRAASSDSKRASTTNMPSSVNPPVEPR